MMMQSDLIYTNKDEVAIRAKNTLDYKRYYQTNHRFDLRSGPGGWAKTNNALTLGGIMTCS